MTNELLPVEQVLIGGDLSKLSGSERLYYYKQICGSLGLNPLTRPFDYITLNGKMTLYAKRDCTDQLRKIHGISITIASRELSDEFYTVTARATDKMGRYDEASAPVPISNLKGEARSNAMMKAETKAKRRVTLSICGLGTLDETEVSSIPDAIYNNQIDPITFVESEERTIGSIAAEVRCLLSEGNVKEAYSICESLTDNKEKSHLWSLLDTTERDSLKKMKEEE